MRSYVKNSLKAIAMLGIAGGLAFGCAEDKALYQDGVSMVFAKYKRNGAYKKISELKGDKYFSFKEAFGDKTVKMETNTRGTELTIKIMDSKTGSTLEMSDETNGIYAEVWNKPDTERHYFGGIDSVKINGEFLPMQKLSKEDLDDLEKRFDDASIMIMERYEKSIDAKMKDALKILDDTKISKEVAK